MHARGLKKTEFWVQSQEWEDVQQVHQAHAASWLSSVFRVTAWCTDHTSGPELPARWFDWNICGLTLLCRARHISVEAASTYSLLTSSSTLEVPEIKAIEHTGTSETRAFSHGIRDIQTHPRCFARNIEHSS